jgi:hypothetical protein
VALFLACVCAAQAGLPEKWQKEETKDEFRGTALSRFVLIGKFLTPPKRRAEAPLLVLDCTAGEHSLGHEFTNGELRSAYVIVRAVVDNPKTGVIVRYRLDDGKIHANLWDRGTDGKAIFPSREIVNDLFYGHLSKHKEGTNDPVRKVVIAVDEHRGAEMVMQFDMPDPTEAADGCGLIVHKKK